MTYQETIEYMYSSLPMYHRIGAAAYKADIGSTVAMMDILGHPERGFKSIHVAGTNGKGSVSHLLASILGQCGLRVGLYTSPHLVDFRERIRVDGDMIPEQAVCDFIERYRNDIETLQLSFFEMTVGLAFHYFAQQQVDVAVVEVGMGGRLDSTNVIEPMLSIITNIGLDHTQFLGNTLARIAGEKAGIIKNGVPVVIGETHPETEPVFYTVARHTHAPITFADQHYKIAEHPTTNAGRLRFDVLRDGELLYHDLVSPLAGAYQTHNLATLFAALHELDTRPSIRAVMPIDITAYNIRTGIADVIKNTGLHGRWEVIAQKPETILETAHNADGIRAMLQKLGGMRYRRLHIVYGCVNDKDYASILQMLPRDAQRYYTQPSVQRALPVDQLYATACRLGLDGTTYGNVAEAVRAAREAADEDDLILVTGSIFLVADAMKLKIENRKLKYKSIP